MQIGVIGVGSIGSVLAAGLDKLGHNVRINDVDPDVVEAEPHPHASQADLAESCDLIVLAVPTPTTSGGGDVSAVSSVLSEIQDTDATVVLRSTMPPGSTRPLSQSYDLPLVYSPEFLRDRSNVDDFFDPDRIVISGPEEERAVFRKVITDGRIDCDTVFESDDYLPAELAKEAHNAFFATKVSFANQMRTISERAGADAEFVMNVVTADHRNTTSHLDPMLGPYGGSCLPKDTEALRRYAREQNIPTPVLDGTVRMNDIAKENYEYLDIQGNWPNVSVRSD